MNGTIFHGLADLLGVDVDKGLEKSAEAEQVLGEAATGLTGAPDHDGHAIG